ncbi:MAG: hypothetical protein A3J63_02570 [Candidatus Moranbacteria bacterium RIFCSPHIGHO2_02_FULL_40_12b]|nr:MAG: hypothetical protein A3J63_02570 [Candidatus Moranbacteria bacterium RIFCSPHIGHO2_02_FULL_40_12b]OGI23324.1 MAG: hypothetical protein A3E91_00030 [Candidatus Moranbacteria bacterium RIFCSPHIGHO2_12_FULL_40_10]
MKKESLQPELPIEIEELKKKNFKINLALYLIMGILLGVIVKTEAMKRVVVGFDDYKLAGIRRDYDINKLEKDLIEKAKAQKDNPQQQAQGIQAGGICGQ